MTEPANPPEPTSSTPSSRARVDQPQRDSCLHRQILGMMERVQPYQLRHNQRQLAWLRDLSNTDKHRRLNTVAMVLPQESLHASYGACAEVGGQIEWNRHPLHGGSWVVDRFRREGPARHNHRGDRNDVTDPTPPSTMPTECGGPKVPATSWVWHARRSEESGSCLQARQRRPFDVVLCEYRNMIACGGPG